MTWNARRSISLSTRPNPPGEGHFGPWRFPADRVAPGSLSRLIAPGVFTEMKRPQKSHPRTSNPMATQPARDVAIHEMPKKPPQKAKPVLSRQKPAGRAATLRTEALLKQRAIGRKQEVIGTAVNLSQLELPTTSLRFSIAAFF